MELIKERIYRCCQYIDEEKQCVGEALKNENYCEYCITKVCEHKNIKYTKFYFYEREDEILIYQNKECPDCNYSSGYAWEPHYNEKIINFETIKEYFETPYGVKSYTEEEKINRFNKLYDFLTKK
ncbi:MAG: hypothetical protein SPLM_07510 [Spiroplasma phoeniceum]|uniref:hypothetical protein n=1 Tax=Spiroplasma phoeniceum TaxID=47835 RepID=UPI0032881C04